MSKKRVFANNNDINYQDYMNNKKGIAMIQNQKSIGRQRIQRFLSYQEFIILTRTFFLYSQKRRNLFKAPFTIYQATISKVSFDKINNHIPACDFCFYARDPEDFLKCREIQNILYPYGHYLGESQEIYYPSTLDLTKWCRQCDDKVTFMNDDDDADADFGNTNSDITSECEDCPKVDETDVNPSTGHKPNCECCKRNSSSSSSYLTGKNAFGYSQTKKQLKIKPNCGLCMNTQSLFLRH
jgi:hypothetical protein